ncbi:MAG: prephenate dehydrogenase/arogenate dehydrogenase family protein [Longimicrobiales bacterium]|nr:prephenate dehydrogenase/arogenate dehydrogenase family protein [Longimicrobiales bacterium]
MAERTVAILGLGLIGGSLARDLSALGHPVVGHDREPESVRAALHEGCLRAALGEDLAGIEDADVVILAVPVGAALALLREVGPRLRASLVTDVGSTKRSVLEAAAAAGVAARFVGSHPLAGDHRSGWGASSAGLFRGAPVFLCADPSASPGVLRKASALWRAVGAEPAVIGAEEHDRRMAWLSHLPQAAASALALSIAAPGLSADQMGPGGRDTTRLAASPTALWVDILLDNADLVEPALASLEASVAGVHAAVRRRDAAALGRLFDEAKRWREGGGERSGGRRGTGELRHD